jgi:hypothetical protein
LHNCNKARRVEADRLRQLNQFDDVETPLAALEAGDPSLGLFELLGQLNLPDSGLFALGRYELNEPLMASTMDGFHSFPNMPNQPFRPNPHI